jgi:hypothetical protein
MTGGEATATGSDDDNNDTDDTDDTDDTGYTRSGAITSRRQRRSYRCNRTVVVGSGGGCVGGGDTDT